MSPSETGLGHAAPRWRLVVVSVVLFACLGMLAMKAGRLQLKLGDDLRELAQKQYVRKLKMSAPRGNVYDRNGRPLAVSVNVSSVYAEPRRIEDPIDAALRLSVVLGKDRDTLERRLLSQRGFVWLARRVDPEIADAVSALKLRGVHLKREPRRYYPNKELAGQVLGMVSIDGEGQSGAERAFDDYLKGRSVLLPGLRDNHGRHISRAQGVDLDVLAGDDVTLTLDAGLQATAEALLVEAVEKHQARSAFAVLMDPHSGAVLVAASAPRLNPNAPSRKAQRNRPIAETFEPGSTFKIVTFAAALEAGELDLGESIFCENGRFKLGKYTIHDAHKAGWLTGAQVFAHSSNIGTIKIAQRVGEERFRDMVGALGFGKRPGLGFVEESRGRLPRQKHWGEVRLATASFGHGLTVTAMQLAVAVSTVANGGVRVQPRLLEKVETAEGDLVTKAESDRVRVFSQDTARKLTSIMKLVVKKGGTGTRAAIPGVEVAGKTGTAEKVDPVTHRYSNKLHTSSFVGFAPADSPRYVGVVVIDEPKGVHAGGATAGPVWRELMQHALIADGTLTAEKLPAEKPKGHKKQRKEPAPRSRSSSTEEALAPLLGLTVRQAIQAASAMGLEVQALGSGLVRQAERTEDGRVLLHLGDTP